MDYRFLRFPGGKQKAVTFSYDDGYNPDIRLSEIFNKYNVKATFNLNSRLGGERRMTTDEVKEHILGCGHEVAIHGAYHLAPGKLTPIEGIREFLDCRLELEERFDMIIRGCAYPNSGITIINNGNSYEKIRGWMADLGIAYARTLGGDNDSFAIPADWLAWMPTAHHENPEIFDYIEKFVSIHNDTSVYPDARYPRLFYVWGHSFEFDRNNNWDRIEKICEKLGGHEDTWYATNIEIHDYVTAYNSLIFSADGTKIYNPTDKKIWIEVIGSGIYTVESGRTIEVKPN